MPLWRFYFVVCVILGSSWDGLWHGVSSAWWKRHKEDKTVHSLRTCSSARWSEGRCSQSLYCGKRGKKKRKKNVFFTPTTLMERNSVSSEDFMVFPCTGDHRHSTDHLWHSHTGAWTAWDDGGGGWSSPSAATSSGQATHYGHWSHLQCLGGDEEPDSPWCTAGGVSEMETGRGVILIAMWNLKPWLCRSDTQ